MHLPNLSTLHFGAPSNDTHAESQLSEIILCYAFVWKPCLEFEERVQVLGEERNSPSYYFNALILSINGMTLRLTQANPQVNVKAVVHMHIACKHLETQLPMNCNVVYCDQSFNWRYPILSRVSTLINSNDESATVILLDAHDCPNEQFDLASSLLKAMSCCGKGLGLTFWPTNGRSADTLQGEQQNASGLQQAIEMSERKYRTIPPISPGFKVYADTDETKMPWFVDCGLAISTAKFRGLVKKWDYKQIILDTATSKFRNLWSEFQLAPDEVLFDLFLFRHDKELANIVKSNCSIASHWLVASEDTHVVNETDIPPRPCYEDSAKNDKINGDSELTVAGQSEPFSELLKGRILIWGQESQTLMPKKKLKPMPR